MRREMVEELFALGNLPTARRTPSVERRIAELAAAIDSGDSSAPPRRKRKKRKKKKKTPKSSSFHILLRCAATARWARVPLSLVWTSL